MEKSAILELIVRHSLEVLPDLEGRTLQGHDSLQELGANSLDRAEIVALVLDSLSLRVPRVELVGPRNLNELAELLSAKLLAK